MITDSVGAGINNRPISLCGGSGTRLWPLSRSGFPNQFLSLTGDARLFQLAAQRLVGLGTDDIHVAKPLILTGEEHRFLALEQLREVHIELSAALLEPAGKNTSPALTLAALAALESEGDPTKAREKLGWTPRTTFAQLVAEMASEDLKSA